MEIEQFVSSKRTLYGNRNKFLPKVEDIEFCVNAFNKCRVVSLNPTWDLPDKDKLFTGTKYEVSI